jgi:serine phosphatase RsbU (regulator of sigma subunit)
MKQNKIDKNKLFPYLKEFREVRIKVIKSRIRLFCALTLSVYIITSLLSLLVSSDEFKSAELFTWAFLILIAALVLFINQKTKTLLQAKANAFLFTISLIAALTAAFLIYPEYISRGIGVFLLVLFSVSFIIPWGSFEIIFIGALNFLVYSFLYIWNNFFITKNIKHVFPLAEYFDGIIYLAITLIICLIIRKRDDEREKEIFILLKELEKKNEQMEKELALARDVHKTLIPKSKSTENADIAVNYIPVSTVGGDYATFHPTKEGALFFLIGDITGHGIPAALLVNRLYGEVETLFIQNHTPGTLLRELDKFVQEHFKQTQMYLSVCAGLIDFKGKTLFYSNYGHPPQILHKRQDNKIYLLESQTHLLGVNDMGNEQNKVFEGSLSFEHKDRIILFTDGIIEIRGKGSEFYGMQRLEDFVKNHVNEYPTLFNNNLLKEIEEFRRGPVTDDIFLLTIDIK